jgi:DNA invertase Pin-like site-specific DNA recombinase
MSLHYPQIHDPGIQHEPQALLAVVRKRHIDVVLVWRYDRFARSTQALVQALNEFHRLGVDFIS